MGGLEKSLPAETAPVKAPFDVTEERRLEELRWNRTCVDRNKGFAVARAQAVNRPGHELFAGAALTGDHDVGSRRSGPADELEDLLHPATGADDLTHAFEPAAEQQILDQQPAALGARRTRCNTSSFLNGLGT